MNITVGIIDQHVRGLASRLKSEIEDTIGKSLDERALLSVAFVLLCTKVMLDLADEDALAALTEGGNDFGVDAIGVGDVSDGEFTVTLFQAKYEADKLDGAKGFPQSGVEKAVQAVRSLFDPRAPIHVNPRLQAQVEEVRSFIVDGNIPRVRVLLCNNGQPWKQPEAQEIIDREKFGDRAVFEHVDHERLVRILQSNTPVKDTLHCTGKAIVEDFNYARVFVGKIAVSELARLMDTHGDRLLERNIRRYLGLMGNRVNEGIRSTLEQPNERQNFYFYNNGITLICDRFEYNALQSENYHVRVEGLQIINGGQTSKTVQATLADLAKQLPAMRENLESAFVLMRLYQVPSTAKGFVRTITYATNSQNPVDLKDLRSNDKRQIDLEQSMKSLGFDYRRQRAEGVLRPNEISVGTAAEAVLSVWRSLPQQAKFRSGDHFGKLYDIIFRDDLNGAQVVTAVLLFRIAENKRRRPPSGSPEFVRYASCFAAMLMGRSLLTDLAITRQQLDHREFERARQLIDSKGEAYYDAAIAKLDAAIKQLYGQAQVSLQRLAATFRRGDLMQYLP